MLFAQENALELLLVALGIVKIRLSIAVVIGQQGRRSAVTSNACSDHGWRKLGIGLPVTKHFRHFARFHKTLPHRAACAAKAHP